MRDLFLHIQLYSRTYVHVYVCMYIRTYVYVCHTSGMLSGLHQNIQQVLCTSWAKGKQQRAQGYGRAKALGVQPQSCRRSRRVAKRAQLTTSMVCDDVHSLALLMYFGVRYIFCACVVLVYIVYMYIMHVPFLKQLTYFMYTYIICTRTCDWATVFHICTCDALLTTSRMHMLCDSQI